MGFVVKKAELNDLQDDVTNTCKASQESLENLMKDIETFSSNAAFEGEAATSLKSYFSEVYGLVGYSLIVALGKAVFDYRKILDNFNAEVDNDCIATLKEDYLEQKHSEINGIYNAFESFDRGLQNLMDNNVHLIDLGTTGGQTLLTSFADTDYTLKDAKQKLSNFATKGNGELSDLKELLNNIKTTLESVKSNYTSGLSINYQSMDVLANESFYGLAMSLEKNQSEALYLVNEDEADWRFDIFQNILAVAGMVPVVGDVLDIINSVIYFTKGKNLDGMICMLGVVGLPTGVIMGVKGLSKAGKLDNIVSLFSKGEKVSEIGVKNISFSDYVKVYKSSIKNPDAEIVMLGKYDGGASTSYINRAGKDYTYFDLGSQWGEVKKAQGLTDNEMFSLYNEAFLDDAINARKSIQFSHSPLGDTGFLGQELKYLEKNNYIYDESTMMAMPKY